MPYISLTVAVLVLSLALSAAAAPTVNGLFFGDGDHARYTPYAAAEGGRGTIYTHVEGGILYAAVVVSHTVNDNVFGLRRSDDDYLASAGWGVSNPSHKALDLLRSEHIELSLSCSQTAWTWRQDLLHDAGGDEDPAGSDWLSDHTGPDGGGTPPPGLVSRSSTQWNFAWSSWDMTLGGARQGPTSWKSPDDGSGFVHSLGYPGHDHVHGWEWPIVYEMSMPLPCGDDFVLRVVSAHNSPPKDGNEDVAIVAMDYGDADDPSHPTRNGNDPARHVIVSGFFLGSSVDAEIDGQPDGSALGDDLNGIDDEDGVEFLTPLDPGSMATISVTASAPGWLDAWADFNGDGDWDDPGEHLFAGVALNAGKNTLSFAVPAGANFPRAFARFRFSSVGGLPYHGLAPDGEVEDYLISSIRVPVELSMFTATFRDGAIELAWMTHSESENLGFRLLRSSDGREAYEEISDLIPGAGTTTVARTYRYLDDAVESNVTYHYLLADVSFQGEVATHGPVTARIPTAPLALRLDAPRPNPFREAAMIRYTIPESGRIKLALYELSGRERTVFANGSSPAGSFTALLGRADDSGRRLASGSYLMVLQTEKGSMSQRVVVLD